MPVDVLETADVVETPQEISEDEFTGANPAEDQLRVRTVQLKKGVEDERKPDGARTGSGALRRIFEGHEEFLGWTPD